jgi:penicillin-binding protein 1A
MGVWLGNNDPTPLKNGNSSLPGTIINEVMAYAHEEVYQKEGKWKPGDWYTMPTGVQKIGNELYPSWYNKNKAQQFSKLTFDKVSKKLATDCTPAAAKIDISVVKTTDPTNKKTVYVASGGYDASSNDDVHQCGDAPPTVSVTISGSGPTYTIIATVSQGKGNINDVTISVDGTTISDQTVNGPGSYSVPYTPSGSGSFTATAVATDDLYYQGTGSNTH